MLKILTKLYRQKNELRRLNRAAHGYPSPTLSEMVKLDVYQAIWCIVVPGQEDRFMSTSSGAINDQIYVVHVETEAFYRAWLTCGSWQPKKQRGSDCILRSDMPNDYKYQDAARGFSNGFNNPVPLAHAGAWNDGKKIHIGFTNGVTRTFWLIANYAVTFPVQVRGEQSAKELYRLAGIGDGPISFKSIFDNAPRP